MKSVFSINFLTSLQFSYFHQVWVNATLRWLPFIPFMSVGVELIVSVSNAYADPSSSD